MQQTHLDVKQSKVHAGEAGQRKEFKDVTGVMEGVQSYFDRAAPVVQW
uniref:Uncharacterized protein n=1 Tax=Peronospora matthiolae TaxID=2874970 RepID=A0AAV1U102_9STRA